MKKIGVGMAVLAVLCLWAGIVGAQDAAPTDGAGENLSDGRTVGIGIQVEYPWGGLVSTRYWLSPEIGAEGVVFLNGSAGWLEGSATLRALFRVVDAATVDFYVGAGATLPFPMYGGSEVLFAGVGGIEFNFRSAPNLAWNI